MDEELYRLMNLVQMTGSTEAGKQLLYALAGRNISIKALHFEYGIPYHLLWDQVRGAEPGATHEKIMEIIRLLDHRLPDTQWVFDKESLIKTTTEAHYAATIQDTLGRYKFLYIDDVIKHLRKLYEVDPRVPDASAIALLISQQMEDHNA